MTYQVVEWERGVPSVGACVAALGVFDGVHVGHQTLVKAAVSLAGKYDLPAVAITFDRDPDQVVTPDSAAPQLLTLDQKLHYLGECGADHIVVLPFCMKMSKLAPEVFVREILCEAVEPRLIVVGADFRFGTRASGDVRALAKIGTLAGFDVVAQPLVEVDSRPVTSTRIRTLIADGDVKTAASLLGRAHRITGTVTRGRGEGTEVVVPTANLIPVRFAAVPADGVYAGHAELEQTRKPAAISVGVSPSFSGARHVVEAHLLGFDGDLYHAEMTLTFAERIRELASFEDPTALKAQVMDDIARTRKITS